MGVDWGAEVAIGNVPGVSVGMDCDLEVAVEVAPGEEVDSGDDWLHAVDIKRTPSPRITHFDDMLIWISVVLLSATKEVTFAADHIYDTLLR